MPVWNSPVDTTKRPGDHQHERVGEAGQRLRGREDAREEQRQQRHQRHQVEAQAVAHEERDGDAEDHEHEERIGAHRRTAYALAAGRRTSTRVPRPWHGRGAGARLASMMWRVGRSWGAPARDRGAMQQSRRCHRHHSRHQRQDVHFSYGSRPAVRGVVRRGARRGAGLPRPERRRQVDDHQDAHRPVPPREGAHRAAGPGPRDDREALQGRIGVCFEEKNLYPTLSGVEHLRFFARCTASATSTPAHCWRASGSPRAGATASPGTRRACANG
jgi:hypothetical protein